MKRHDWSDQRFYTVAFTCIVAGMLGLIAYGAVFERTTGEPLCDPVLTLEECQQ